MKKNIKIIILTIFSITMLSLACNAQRVWNDDRRPEYKADTSIVEIRGLFYKKIISVNYIEVNEQILQEQFDNARQAIRTQRQELNRRMREDSITLAKLQQELEMHRTFFRLARKDLKIAARNADQLGEAREKKQQEQEEQNKTRTALIEGTIIANPRKKQ